MSSRDGKFWDLFLSLFLLALSSVPNFLSLSSSSLPFSSILTFNDFLFHIISSFFFSNIFFLLLDLDSSSPRRALSRTESEFRTKFNFFSWMKWSLIGRRLNYFSFHFISDSLSLIWSKIVLTNCVLLWRTPQRVCVCVDWVDSEHTRGVSVLSWKSNKN